MFITESERNGSCYFEFQFCKADRPLKDNCVDINAIDYWKNDSLLISDKNFDSFYGLYKDVFDCALLPNGKKGFDYFGVNYYNNETAEKMLQELEHINEYKPLILWLKVVMKKYNGFYILGI